MEAEIPSGVHTIARPLPLIKAGSIEWSGERMRPDLQVTLFILMSLALLLGLLLIFIPAQLRTLSFDTLAPVERDAGASIQISSESAACAPRTDWANYPIQPDDSLAELARRTGISITMLVNSNCLETAELQSGNTLYLPAVPTR